MEYYLAGGEEHKLVREVERYRLEIVGLTSMHGLVSGTSFVDQIFILSNIWMCVGVYMSFVQLCPVGGAVGSMGCLVCRCVLFSLCTMAARAVHIAGIQLEKDGVPTLSQVEEFKYLGVLFTSKGRRQQGNGQTDLVCGCSATGHHGEDKAKHKNKPFNLSIYSSYKCSWALGSNKNNEIAVVEMSFVWWVAGLVHSFKRGQE